MVDKKPRFQDLTAGDFLHTVADLRSLDRERRKQVAALSAALEKAEERLDRHHKQALIQVVKCPLCRGSIAAAIARTTGAPCQ